MTNKERSELLANMKLLLKDIEFQIVNEYIKFYPECSRHQGLIVGHAFTSYTCKICNTQKQHPNTGTPNMCRTCAVYLNQCWYCGAKLIDLHTPIMALLKKAIYKLD